MRLKAIPNVSKSLREYKDTSIHGIVRLRSLQVYFKSLMEGIGRMDASFERRCHRYMQVYQQGLPPHLVEFAVKKYASHRHPPSENLLAMMEDEFERRKE